MHDFVIACCGRNERMRGGISFSSLLAVHLFVTATMASASSTRLSVASPSSLADTVELASLSSSSSSSNGVRMPRFGLGVYESDGEDCYKSVLWALEVSGDGVVVELAGLTVLVGIQAGYRLIEQVVTRF